MVDWLFVGFKSAVWTIFTSEVICEVQVQKQGGNKEKQEEKRRHVLGSRTVKLQK